MIFKIITPEMSTIAKKYFRLLLMIMSVTLDYRPSHAQGLNHQWLLGYGTFTDSFTTSQKARLLFDSNSVTVVPETRKMKFRAAQANISDSSGNLLFVSNGIWVADATNDTMQNGGGLNPGVFTTVWQNNGMPFTNQVLALPWPDDPFKYILFHSTGDPSTAINLPTELMYSVIDMNLNGSLGAVVQKNVVVLQDLLCPTLAACKHANGRDWWIVMMRDSSDLVYTMLLTPSGISSITTQSLGFPPHNSFNYSMGFSPDGQKFAYSYISGIFGNAYRDIRILDFDRCSGMFSNPLLIDLSTPNGGLGMAFSPNSKYLYVADFDQIYQINTDTTDIPASVQIVAINDGYYSPQPPFWTDFWLMYLAANGKIYISSGNGVIDMHYINYPDSAGLACDVQQHALHLPCYYFRGHVNHPNYYLGCDTTLGCPCLTTGIDEPPGHDFKFSVSPNPTGGAVKLIYMLPQNKEGKLEIYDINGRRVYEMRLPPWSTLQQIDVTFLSSGVYSCVVSSGGYREVRKLVVVRE
jgi:hypothetical protein